VATHGIENVLLFHILLETDSAVQGGQITSKASLDTGFQVRIIRKKDVHA
jgi:hypothetical protein